ncbi:MAG: hypothetical protein WC645_04535 [Candidatus Margulisiibacteriota bacterium]
MTTTQPVSLRCRFLHRVISESLRYRPHPQADIPVIRANVHRFLTDGMPIEPSHDRAAIDLICKSCARLRDLGQTPAQVADLIGKAQQLARSLPTFPWNERRLKSLALQDIGSTMHQICWDRAETIGVLKESLREASLVDGAKWGNSEKTRVIREIKALIQKAEKSS